MKILREFAIETEIKIKNIRVVILNDMSVPTDNNISVKKYNKTGRKRPEYINCKNIASYNYYQASNSWSTGNDLERD